MSLSTWAPISVRLEECGRGTRSCGEFFFIVIVTVFFLRFLFYSDVSLFLFLDPLIILDIFIYIHVHIFLLYFNNFHFFSFKSFFIPLFFDFFTHVFPHFFFLSLHCSPLSIQIYIDVLQLYNSAFFFFTFGIVSSIFSIYVRPLSLFLYPPVTSDIHRLLTTHYIAHMLSCLFFSPSYQRFRSHPRSNHTRVINQPRETTFLGWGSSHCSIEPQVVLSVS